MTPQPGRGSRNRRLRAAAVIAVVVCAQAAPEAHAAGPTARDEARTIRAQLQHAPFFTELFVPRGRALGVAITFHRGAWAASGKDAAASEHADDHAWLRRRWLVVNSSYRPGTLGLRDVRLVFRRVQRATHARHPICLVGASSGGNLALTAAASLTHVGCVVAEAAPTDLVDIATQTAYDPGAEGGRSSTGPAYIRDAAVQALGEPNLNTFSPVFHAERIDAPVLLAESAQDPLIPPEQGNDLCARLGTRCAGSMSLAAGPLWFVHAGVARAALSSFRAAETRLARQVAAPYAP